MDILSIVTPTYNRAYTLPRLYKSLLQQTNRNFEWIVVDDGSTDETEKIINDWILKSDIRIIYQKKENGGKHTALNYAHQFIKGKLTLIADSDDWLTDDAVESILNDWESYESRKEICGLCYLIGKDKKNSLGNYRFRSKVTVSDFIDIKVKDTNSCDSCEVIRTSVLKEFPFPEYYGEKYIGESYLWYNTALKYKMVFINKIIYIAEYLPDGLSRSGRKLRIECPNGGREVCIVGMDKRFPVNYRIKKGILYNVYSNYLKLTIKQRIAVPGKKIPVILGIVPGLILYRYWRIKYR